MIHLVKSKTGYMVVTVSDTNGEVLAASEILTSKRNAVDNIGAQSCQFGGHDTVFQDDTGEKPVMKLWKFGRKTVRTLNMKAGKKYKAK